MDYFIAVSPEKQNQERRKAQELKKTQWWRQQIGLGLCYYCKKSFPKELLTMDHIIPIARGGKSNKKNVVVCCKECNSQKKYFTPVELTFEMLNKKQTANNSES